MQENTTLIAGGCWMEQTAIDQLNKTAALPGVIRAVGLPDLHAGKIPVGIALETQGILYPHLIGGDIGCGMSLFQTGCALRRYKADRFVTRLNYIRALEELPLTQALPDCPLAAPGTIGGGNHFAEFQRVEEVRDPEAFRQLGIDRERLLLLIHSGSRDYGQRIRDAWPGEKGLEADSEAGRDYLNRHDDALRWAVINRRLAGEKLMTVLGYDPGLTPVIDCCHNFVERWGENWLHRKGTVAAQGITVLPGSRGSLTYLLKPAADTSISAWSLSHGAGRKWARSLCRSRIAGKYDRDTIRRTQLGSRVVCHDTGLLYEEAPEAYKNVEKVLSALVDSGLCTVVASLRPLVTYKG